MALNIIDISSPNWSSRDGAVPRWLILHGTAGFTTAQDVGAYFATAASQVSAHYVVGQDGVVVRCVDEANAAWANGPITGPAGVGGDGIHHDAWWDNAPLWFGVPNPNPVTISIEHVKPHIDNSDILTAAQQAASFALILDICKRQSIPMRAADSSGGITGHFSMDPVNRSRCPGPYPWDALWTYLNSNGGTMGVPQGWSDNGSVLTAPNGHKVTQGFRVKVLEGWSAANVPLEEAEGVPGGTRQTFLLSELVWTPQTGVFIANIGTELLAARSQITALQAEITALQSSQPAQIAAAISSDLQTIATATQDALSKLKSS